MSEFKTEGKQVVDMMNGYPPLNLLPNELVADACKATLAMPEVDGESAPLDYGDYTGYFGRKLCSFLGKYDTRTNLSPRRIVPTAGVSNGLNMLTTYFMKRSGHQKGVVFVEDETYYMSAAVFTDLGVDVVGVPTLGTGIHLEVLERLLEKHCGPDCEDKRVPLFLYVIPSFNNPTGRTMTKNDRVSLLELTKKYDLPVVADEVYQLLNITRELQSYINSLEAGDVHPTLRATKFLSPDLSESEGRTPCSMSAFGYPHCYSLGSFAKILAPGLRSGWVEFPSDADADEFVGLGVMGSGGNIAHFSSCVTATCMDITDSGSVLWSHILHLRTVYAAKWYALANSLCKHSAELLPPGEDNQVTIGGVGPLGAAQIGGFFVWVRFPQWCSLLSGDELLTLATEFGVTFRLGSDCMVPVPDYSANDNFVYGRLCYARCSLEELELGGKLICEFAASLPRS